MVEYNSIAGSVNSVDGYECLNIYRVKVVIYVTSGPKVLPDFIIFLIIQSCA